MEASHSTQSGSRGRGTCGTKTRFRVTVVYDGDHSLLDPAKLNAISSGIVDRLLELGINNTVIESHVEKGEYADRQERRGRSVAA